MPIPAKLGHPVRHDYEYALAVCPLDLRAGETPPCTEQRGSGLAHLLKKLLAAAKPREIAEKHHLPPKGTGAEMAWLYKISAPTMLGIVAAHHTTPHHTHPP